MPEEETELTRGQMIRLWLFMMLSKLWTKFKETFPPNRVVLILGPTVLLPACAWISATLAANVPNATFTDTQILAFVLPSLLGGLILLYKWFDGWIKSQIEHKPRTDVPMIASRMLNAPAPPNNTTVVVNPPGTVEIHPDDAKVAEGTETPPPVAGGLESARPSPHFLGD